MSFAAFLAALAALSWALSHIHALRHAARERTTARLWRMVESPRRVRLAIAKGQVARDPSRYVQPALWVA